MKNLKYILLSITVLLGSCKKFLVEEPFSLKTPSGLLQSESLAQAFVIGLYDKLSNTPNSRSFSAGLL